MRKVELLLLDQRIADLEPLRLEERECHPAADHQHIDLRQQVLDDVDLPGDLRAAEDGDVRTPGIADRPGRDIRSPSSSGSRRRTGFRNRVTPSVEACARCAVPNASLTYTSPRLASSFANVSSFFSSSAWKRRFSSRRHFARLQRRRPLPAPACRCSRWRTCTGRFSSVAEMLGDRLQRELRVRASLSGRPRWLIRITAPPSCEDLPDGRERLDDPLVVGRPSGPASSGR